MKLLGAFRPDPAAQAQLVRVTAEQARLDRLTAIEEAQRTLELQIQQQRAQTQLDKDKRRAAAERRADKRAALSERTARVRQIAQTIGRRGLIVGPIVAPMAVAWIGQIGFALGILGWQLAGAVVFAASWELTTAFCGWMYHQARQDGDAGQGHYDPRVDHGRAVAGARRSS